MNDNWRSGNSRYLDKDGKEIFGPDAQPAPEAGYHNEEDAPKEESPKEQAVDAGKSRKPGSASKKTGGRS